MLHSRSAVRAGSRPLLRPLSARNISVSPAAPRTPANTANAYNDKLYKLSYETAKNRPVSQSEFSVPERKFEFSNYKLASNNNDILITEENALLIPSILALHARLSLPKEFTYSNLVKCLTCQSKESTKPALNNQQLSIFGAHILSFYVSEYLAANYPRLPISILKNAIDAYIGNFSLYDVAKNSWGIEEDSTSQLDKYLANEPELFKFGKIRYNRKVTQPESNVTKYSKSIENPFELSKSEAYANSVRSIIAQIYLSTSEDQAKLFIKNHILSRQVDITNFFSFKEPGKLLTRLLRSNNMEPPTVRLISETGRLSSTPVYVVGCFSGDNLLATSEGNSLKEARVKSFGKALKAWYLYKPLDAKSPSDNDFTGMHVDQGEKFY